MFDGRHDLAHVHLITIVTPRAHEHVRAVANPCGSESGSRGSFYDGDHVPRRDVSEILCVPHSIAHQPARRPYVRSFNFIEIPQNM